MAGAPDDWRTCPDVAARVAALLDAMTLDDRIDLVTGDPHPGFGFYNAPIASVGIPALTMADGPAGVRLPDAAVHGGRATALPAPIALAATWDVSLARRYGGVLGAEARASGHDIVLGPCVDIARVPVAGRSFEGFGEDPILTARMGAAEIEGIQAEGVVACVKHFAANNQEWGRATLDAHIGEQALRELYLRPFEVIVRSTAVGAVMGAYNRVNGQSACEHEWLLSQILRGEWNFRGWVMSDHSATPSTVAAARAGLDQEMPGGVRYGRLLRAAVDAGEIAPETLDEMCRRILRPVVGLGLLDRPPQVGPALHARHRATAQAVAERGAVLLKNDGLLPIDAVAVARVVVVGVDADTCGAAGGGSAKVAPAFCVSLLDGLREHLGSRVVVEHVPGGDPVTAADLLPGLESVPSAYLRASNSDARGVLASWWDNAAFDGAPRGALVVPQVAVNEGFFSLPGFSADSPHATSWPPGPTARTAIRFEGRLVTPVDGVYALSVTLLGSATLWLDDRVVLVCHHHGRGRTGGDVGATTNPGSPFVAGADQGRAATVADTADDADVFTCHVTLSGGTRGHRFRLDYVADAPVQGDLVGAQVRLGWHPPAGLVSPDVVAAAERARGADLVVVVARAIESEHMDRPSLALPNGQPALICAVAAANPRTVVVTMSGGPVETRSWDGGVAAVLHAWYAGQEQGRALARLLTGDVAPSGRLPVTFPDDAHDTAIMTPAGYPGVAGHVAYDEGLFVGYRADTAQGRVPRFPFGHGLSYTHFAYDALTVRSTADGISVTCRVTNDGPRAGHEVVQVYLDVPGDGQPPRRLVDWVVAWLQPGESTVLRFDIARASMERPFGCWSPDRGWVDGQGAIGVCIGASSADIRLSLTVG